MSYIRRLVGMMLVALAVFMPALAPNPAFALTMTELIERGNVRIGVLTGSPPMGTIDERGNPAGYDVDVADKIAEYLGLPAELIPLTPPARIPALQSGEIDFLIATLAPTTERAKSVMFTSPYNAFAVGILSGPDQAFPTMESLADKRVGMNNSGSPQEAALRRAQIPGLEIVHYDDDSLVIQALLSGQVDATAVPSTVAASIMEQFHDAKLQVGLTLFHQGNSMAVRLGDFEILQYLNNVIYQMKQNGDLDAISMRWLGEPLPELPVF